MQRLLVWLIFLWPGLVFAQNFQSREDKFIYAQDTPPVVGELASSQSHEDEARQLNYSKQEFRYETKSHIIVTHVSKVVCGGTEMLEDLHIMAIQYLPRVPTSFLDATRHDYYKDVYVRDEEGRLRLYEDVTGMQMVELMARFQPDCVSL